MKILSFCPRYIPTLSGGETAAHGVHRALAARGHQVSVVTSTQSARRRVRETVEGVEVDLGPYPRWSNDYASVEHGAWATRIDLADQRLVLDFETGERRLLQRD